jgi:hypothetical protein
VIDIANCLINKVYFAHALRRQTLLASSSLHYFDTHLQVRDQKIMCIQALCADHCVNTVPWLNHHIDSPAVRYPRVTLGLLMGAILTAVFKECILFCYSINYVLKCSCLNTVTIKTHSHFTVQQMSLYVVICYFCLGDTWSLIETEERLD